MKVENMETTTTNSYQIQDVGANSQELDMKNIDNNLQVGGDDKTYLVEEIYPPFIAKFMKYVGRIFFRLVKMAK
jgi:hypothetical protein